jgi:beta-lactamase class A
MRTRLCLLALAAALALAGCGRIPAAAGRPVAQPAPLMTPANEGGTPPRSAGVAPEDTVAQVAPGQAACATAGWDCAQLARFDAAARYVQGRPGRLGVVVHDRATGAVWRSGATADPMWTASTIKVAIATTLLERQRSGKIKLSGSDRSAMADMLKNSSNDAANTLWKRYDGPKMLDRFRSGYGMTTLSVVPGEDVYWRNLRCTAEDLDHLMSYVLGGQLHADDRAYLVDTLRDVAGNQRWGVWAAGPGLKPGNKDGWAMKPDAGGDHWVAHTVGFVGPNERYAVTVMYSLPPGAELDTGVQAVSDVVGIVFGVQTPVRVNSPSS